MYRLMVQSAFAAAHQLRGYEGKCEGLHGHNWRVQVMVKTDILNPTGLGIDFKVLKEILKEVLSQLDHAFLNDIEPFKTQNPSSENLARHIFEEFSNFLQHLLNVWSNNHNHLLLKYRIYHTYLLFLLFFSCLKVRYV